MTKRQGQKRWVQELTDPRLLAEAPDSIKAQVGAAHLGIYSELATVSMAVTVVVAALVVLSLQSHVPLAMLMVWATVVVLVSLLRAWSARRFLGAEGSPARTRRWGRWACVGSLLQGLAWASLLVIVVQAGHEADRLITLFTLCALGFGAFATTGFFLPAYLCFALPLLGSIFLWFLLDVPELSLWMGLLIATGCVVMTQAGRRSSRVLQGALLLSRERDSWASRTEQDKERLQVTLGAIGDGVITVDAEGRVEYLNLTAERLTGWGSEQAGGHDLNEVLALAGASDLVAECVRDASVAAMPGEQRLPRRDGAAEASVQVKATPIFAASGEPRGAVVVLHDVTALAGLAEAISYQAEHDGLTGLPNRKSFELLLASAIEYAGLDGHPHAVCYMDLDQFKVVNDTCGHAAGDELLKQVVEMLHERIRESDVLARLGGDEFGILLHRCPLAKAREIAEDLLAMIREFRFTWEDKVFTLGVSIGVVPVEGGSAALHLAAADSACFVAKDRGRNRIHVVDGEDPEVASRHGEMQLTSQIQRALDENLFRLRYQKIMPLHGGGIEAEFLVSMVQPDGSMVPPGVFLPAAERFNMMPKLDRHIIRLALAYAVSDRPELGDVTSYAINLSGQSLADDSLLEYVLEAIDRSGIDARRLCFEITETAVIANLERAMRFIEGLRARGCRFALDDFGSGLSSFGYLRNLPVDYLKIDGQFVKDMCADPINYSMVEAIHRVGHVMGLKTVAEFVEDEATAESLRALGVDYGQGWGLHRPELLAELELKSA